jgi:hypothetical protein
MLSATSATSVVENAEVSESPHAIEDPESESEIGVESQPEAFAELSSQDRLSILDQAG